MPANVRRRWWVLGALAILALWVGAFAFLGGSGGGDEGGYGFDHRGRLRSSP